MAIYFCKTSAIVATPSDANDGLDPIGFGLATATYNDTTKTLTQSGAFSSYTFSTGDLIYISGGTNATVGLYTIASKVDNDSITLTTSAGSTDATGDWTSSNGPFATPQAGTNAVAAGDEVRICDDGTFSLTSAWTWGALSTPGTAASPIEFYGASARGLDTYRGTANQATVKRTTDTTLLYDNNTGGSIEYTRFYNIKFADSKEGAAILNVQEGLQFIDCRFTNNSLYGLQVGAAGSIIACIRCEADLNGLDGFGAATAQVGNLLFFDCSSHDNTRYGYRIGAFGVLQNCLSYDNTDDGIHFEFTTSPRFCIATHCVSHGNGGDGFILTGVTSGEAHLVIRNNIFSGNTGYGLNFDTETPARMMIGPNTYYNNTAGEASTDGIAEVSGPSLEVGNLIAGIDTDPSFTSVVDGSENFVPTSQASTFSDGEAGDCPTGLGDIRQTYLGAVPPDLGAGGDGLGGGGYILGG